MSEYASSIILDAIDAVDAACDSVYNWGDHTCFNLMTLNRIAIEEQPAQQVVVHAQDLAARDAELAALLLGNNIRRRTDTWREYAEEAPLRRSDIIHEDDLVFGDVITVVSNRFK